MTFVGQQNLIFNERKYYNRLKKDAEENNREEDYEYFDGMQHNRKILINSYYGYISQPKSRFFDLENASVVTAGGRELIQLFSNNANDYLKNYLPQRINKYYDTQDIVVVKKNSIDKRFY